MFRFQDVKSTEKICKYKVMSSDTPVRVCWDVQPDSFKIRLKDEKAYSLRELIRAEDDEFVYPKVEKNIHNMKTNAYIQMFDRDDDQDDEKGEFKPITAYHKVLVANGGDSGSLILYINADKGGLRPTKESIEGATPLTIFQKTISSRSKGSGQKLKTEGKFKNFASETEYNQFIDQSKTSKYDPDKGKHTLSDETFTDKAKQFIPGKDAWNKGIFLSVLDVVSTFPPGVCEAEGNLKKTLTDNHFFAAETPHCVFFDVLVGKYEETILLKFVIDKPESKKCSESTEKESVKKNGENRIKSDSVDLKKQQETRQQPSAPQKGASTGSGSVAPPKPDKKHVESTETTDVDGAATAIMRQLQSAYDNFKNAHPSSQNNAGLNVLLDSKVYPVLEQREAYTIQANTELWGKIKAYLKETGENPESLKQIYGIFDGKEWYEEDPATANLRNILDACISLWKFRSLNPPIEAAAAAI